MKLRTTFKQLVLQTPLPEWILYRRSSRYLAILAYHRVVAQPDRDYPFDDGVISGTLDEMEQQLCYLQRHLDFVSCDQLLDGLEHPSSLPPRPALITFDDGYRDNFEVVLPLLKARGLSASFFLCTDLVGTRKIPWWDRIACCLKHARVDSLRSPFGIDDPAYDLRGNRAGAIRRFIRRIKDVRWDRALKIVELLQEQTRVTPEDYLDDPLFMSWEEARIMAASGMDLGGHTRTHPILGQVTDPAVVRAEVGGCFEDLVTHLGTGPRGFAYPVGSESAMSALADAEIKRAGFTCSFSHVNGFAPRRPVDLTRLPRLRMSYGADVASFRLGMAASPVRSA